MFFGRHKDKLEGPIPDEFLVEVQGLKETREYTIDIVKYMEKMVKDALPSHNVAATPMEQKAIAVQQDELQKLAQTCENYMHYFYEQRYYYVLKSSSEVCVQLSKRQKFTIQEIHDRAMLPIKVWVEEEYPRFIRDLQRCAKLRKESDAANHAFAAKPTPLKETKAQNAKDLYEQHLKMCTTQVERERKVRKHHTSCLKLMAAMQHRYSKSVLEEIEKAQGRLITQLTELENKEKMKKESTKRDTEETERRSKLSSKTKKSVM